MAAMDDALAARVEALEAELAVMRRAGGLRSRSTDVPEAVEQEVTVSSPVSDRRGVVKLLAASAVGAVAGVALHGEKVAADDGNPVLQGSTNNAQAATILTASNDTALVVGTDAGYGLEANGSAGNALFTATGASPVGTPAFAGTLWIDGDGNWWGATRSDIDDGQWRKLTGPETAGALHLLSSPRRVYDSRPAEPPAIGPKAALDPNSARSIDPLGNSSGVPSSARGVLVTLTIAEPTAGGFATAWPSGPWPGTSNINFNAGQNIATTTVVGLGSDAKFLVLANVATHVLIDIVGYYL